MNKFFTLVVLGVLALAGLATYWYLKPHHMPRFLSDVAPGLEVPKLKSPMTNFRPPQF